MQLELPAVTGMTQQLQEHGIMLDGVVDQLSGQTAALLAAGVVESPPALTAATADVASSDRRRRLQTAPAHDGAAGRRPTAAAAW